MSASESPIAALPPLLTLPSPFADHPGVVRLLEPADAPQETLQERLRDGNYDKPFLLEDAHVRGLLFGLEYIQSSMRLAAPDALDLIYTQYMMGFLLFHTNVKRIALLGLGGGSLAKFCYRHLPDADLTAIEADANVLAFRDAFCIPPDDDRFHAVQADAGQFIVERAAGPSRDANFDVLLVDVFDGKGLADSVTAQDFYHNARRCLAAKGVLVANLTGTAAERSAHLDLIHHAFGDNLLLVSVDDACNHVAFAFQDRNFEPRWKWIDGQAAAMQRRYGLDFAKMARELQHNWRYGWEMVRL